MHEFPETRDSLLVQVRDPANREAWEQFADIYRPIIWRIAVARGFQDADAHDLAQQVLISVAAAIGRWEKNNEQTRFRNWLSRVTKNAILNALMRQPDDRASGGSSARIVLDEVVQRDQAAEELLKVEYRREIYLRAAEQVRVDVADKTWQAFELSVVDGIDIATVAKRLGSSPGAVYSARSRVMYRLRQAIHEFEMQT